MNFTKKEILITLNDIGNSNNINIDKYINDVLENDIPTLAYKFINLYKPISDLGVFNLIYSKRNKNPLYHNFINGKINNYEQSICLSSLLTQMLCYVKTTKDDVIKHSQLIGINSIINALTDYVNTGSFDKINIVYSQFSNLFKDLFKKVV